MNWKHRDALHRAEVQRHERTLDEANRDKLRQEITEVESIAQQCLYLSEQQSDEIQSYICYKISTKTFNLRNILSTINHIGSQSNIEIWESLKIPSKTKIQTEDDIYKHVSKLSVQTKRNIQTMLLQKLAIIHPKLDIAL